MSDAHRHTCLGYPINEEKERAKMQLLIHLPIYLSLDIRINENDRECLSI
jgi:hypothetical protein